MHAGKLILIAGALLALGLAASLLAGRLRIPGLVLFLGVGMLIGSDGISLIDFGNSNHSGDFELAQMVGIIALALILFEGGLAAGFGEIRPVLGSALSLALVGTLLTAIVTGLAAAWLLDISLLKGLLVGAIVSATDGAAIFALLRGSTLKRRLARTLEGEAGMNDPVAVLLVLGFIEWIRLPDYGPLQMALLFVQQLGIGALVGGAVGWAAVEAFRRVNLATGGLYPVASLAVVALAFGAADVLHGSGFLAVYLAGLAMGSTALPARQTVAAFHDGLAWLAQLTMFLTLGLLVNPADLGPIALKGTALALVLVFLARRRLGRLSPHYRALFASIELTIKSLALENMSSIPVTTKAELVARPTDFIVDGARPHVTTRTTGTTGQPAEIWLSRYELELWPALAALSGLLRGEIGPDDCMQINISSRATAAMAQNMAICRLVGARTRPLGIVPAAESLKSLLSGADRAPTLLATYPSYLAQLVKLARRDRRGPEDFRLQRVDCGGEVLSAALARAARDTLGPVLVNDTFGMTEVLPVSGRVCEQGHMHHDLNMGFVEVIDLDTGQPASPGQLGSVVITPYYPYRECMPVFRYDTRDIVRQLADAELTCSLSGTPATSQILGKASHLVHIDGRVVTSRQIVEACEALPGEPWPARFCVRASPQALELTLTQGTAGALVADEVARRIALDGGGLPVKCSIVDDRSSAALRPLRADLIESTFTAENRG